MPNNSLHALRRFGLGPVVSGSSPADPQAWVKSQLDRTDPLPPGLAPTIGLAAKTMRNYQTAEKAHSPLPPGMADLFADQMTAALQFAVTTDLPVRERLVWFYANHFTVSARAGGWDFGLIGPYIHDAIRPHVTGRFGDMLKAVMQHPAMLWYLDNWLSVGPHSQTGQLRHLSINENLAREALELHTLGVHGGYTQRDVTTFAAVLTGRTIIDNGDDPGYIYKAGTHEPGPQTFLGHTFPDTFEGSQTALDFIADHPATHRHLATQLVRHYVADTAPDHCISRIQAVLRDTHGDLKQAMLAIIDLPEAWQPLTKFRAPDDYIIAVLRALNLPPEPGHAVLAATNDLGQPFMSPLLPNGWPDTAESWISGESLLKRADWAMVQASRPGAPPAEQVLHATIGDVCSDATRAAVARSPTPAEALATLFASPEFQRR